MKGESTFFFWTSNSAHRCTDGNLPSTLAHVSNKSKIQDWWKDTDTVAGLDTKKN